MLVIIALLLHSVCEPEKNITATRYQFFKMEQ